MPQTTTQRDRTGARRTDRTAAQRKARARIREALDLRQYVLELPPLLVEQVMIDAHLITDDGTDPDRETIRLALERWVLAKLRHGVPGAAGERGP